MIAANCCTDLVADEHQQGDLAHAEREQRDSAVADDPPPRRANKARVDRAGRRGV